MKKGIGWILAVSGGFFCAVSVLCIPVILIGDDMTLEERMFTLLSIVVMAVASGLIGWMGFKLKAKRAAAPGGLRLVCGQEKREGNKAPLSPKHG